MGDVETLENKFQMLREKFTGLKRSLEYIQDFLNIQGEQIWREELTRIINFAVEKESIALVNKKYQSNLDNQDKYYVPTFIPVDAYDLTFMGRLLRNISDSLGRGNYLDSMSSWYDNEGR
jgi:WASH complex subunit strumpellin